MVIACTFSDKVLAQSEASQDKPPTTEKQAKEELNRWLLPAYEGDAEAQFKVGRLYSQDKLGEPDHKQAVYWYRQAARLGHVLAQYNLGHQFLMGIGVNKSESTAMKWWLEAAKRDHRLAQFNIGRAFYLGIGVEKDLRKSKYWFLRASENGEPKSKDILSQLGWEDEEIDQSLAAEYGLPKLQTSDEPATEVSNSEKQVEIPAKQTAALSKDDAENVKRRNPDSQLAIKEARDRRASPDIKSKIIPIDLSKEIAAEPLTDTEKRPTVQTAIVDEEVKPPSGKKDIAEDEMESAVAIENSSKPKKVKAKKNSKPVSNLKSDEQLVDPAVAQDSTKKIDTSENELADNASSRLIIRDNEHTKSLASRAKSVEKQIEQKKSYPIAVYTNPEIRSVLIAIVDDHEELDVIRKGSQWSSVKSNKGIPVWMHGDFLKVDKTSGDKKAGNTISVDFGTVTGSNVNTRSVPVVAPGTIVGRLNKGERLRVLDKRGKWYRVVAPTRFRAWVKTKDLQPYTAIAKIKSPIAEPAPKERVNQHITNKTIAKEVTAAKSAAKKPLAINDKRIASTRDFEWLFEQNNNHLTLQLGSFRNPKKMQQYLENADFGQSAKLHKIWSLSSNKVKQTVFLYGSYKSRKTAELERKKIGENQAWIRSFGSLQKMLCKRWQEQSPSPTEHKRFCQ